MTHRLSTSTLRCQVVVKENENHNKSFPINLLSSTNNYHVRISTCKTRETKQNASTREGLKNLRKPAKGITEKDLSICLFSKDILRSLKILR